MSVVGVGVGVGVVVAVLAGWAGVADTAGVAEVTVGTAGVAGVADVAGVAGVVPDGVVVDDDMEGVDELAAPAVASGEGWVETVGIVVVANLP